MKHCIPFRLLAGVLLLGTLLLFPACAAKGTRIAEKTEGSLTAELYKSKNIFSRKKILSVTRDGQEILTDKVALLSSAEKSLPAFAEPIAFPDLNADGLPDLTVAVSVSGEQVFEDCYLQTSDGGFVRSEEFSGLANVAPRTDGGLHTVLTFLQSETVGSATDSDAPLRTKTDSVVQYVWEDGIPTPWKRVSLTSYQYPETVIYCYSVAFYSEEDGKFEDSDDDWLSKADYEATDWSFLYYFR